MPCSRGCSVEVQRRSVRSQTAAHIHMFSMFYHRSSTFSVKGQTVSILGFAGHPVAVATTELLLQCRKATMGNT